ncbi:ATP-dependent nuclease [Undibacterium sp. Rencai35W]|uniref:ATP-dependent nuclease n=1 Tax=Undibacterium sp. Rencai35W TaxID=3413046 RepID=UPI003BF28444
MNVILGGGDVGKTSILDAIAMLLHPTNGYPLSDSDYWQRDVDAEFEVEAVMSLPASTGIHTQNAMAWPWEWDATNNAAAIPIEGDQAGREPVFKVRVRGSSDLEVIHELLQPDGSTISMTVGMRRAIGLVRLSGDDRNERDLRLIQGAGLDRLLNDKSLRGRLSRRFAAQGVNDDLSEAAQASLIALDETFGKRSLPTDLGIGFVGGNGLSINALVGLTSNRNGVALPLSSWGSGTRRMAALTIADTLQDKQPISVIDEIERGLEPYRQRRLVSAIKDKGTQIFLTTHSATVLSAATGAALWYVDAQGRIGRLPTDKVGRHQASDPETFLARLAVVAEGITEVGFVSSLFKKYVAENWEDLGIHVTDGKGNDHVLKILEALSSGNLTFAGFADNEGRDPGKWQAVHDRLNGLMFRWPNGCLEEHFIPLVEHAKLLDLITDPENELTSVRLRTLADRLKIADNSFETIVAKAAADGISLHALIVQAATGKVPAEFAEAAAAVRKPFAGHSKQWFKSYSGGQELAAKMHTLGVWVQVRGILLPFLNAIRTQSEMGPLPDDAA